MLGDEVFSRDIEGAVASHLMGQQSNVNTRLFYWKDKYEVDFIHGNIPIEVKFRNEVALKELKGVIRFMERFKPKYGIVITKDLLKMQDNIFFIPAWLFLVIFG